MSTFKGHNTKCHIGVDFSANPIYNRYSYKVTLSNRIYPWVGHTNVTTRISQIDRNLFGKRDNNRVAIVHGTMILFPQTMGKSITNPPDSLIHIVMTITLDKVIRKET